MTQRVLVTGAAGFIGYHTATRLLERGDLVVGLDNLSPYYDPALKEARLARLLRRPGFEFVRLDLCQTDAMAELFATMRIDAVVHLAAQVGVRHSVDNPGAYVASNIAGFLSVLEGCRDSGVNHLVYASSSSVYGASAAPPFSTTDPADRPVSLYAASKRSNELMAHAYSHLFGVPATALRFFTVYGPWGRPDMALSLFARAILAGEPIDLFNNGEHERDFTFVDDAVECVVRVLDRPPPTDPQRVPHRVLNVARGTPRRLMTLVEMLEARLGTRARVNLLPMQPGDMRCTHADVEGLVDAIGYRPSTTLAKGVDAFVDWFQSYHGRRRE